MRDLVLKMSLMTKYFMKYSCISLSVVFPLEFETRVYTPITSWLRLFFRSIVVVVVYRGRTTRVSNGHNTNKLLAYEPLHRIVSTSVNRSRTVSPGWRSAADPYMSAPCVREEPSCPSLRRWISDRSRINGSSARTPSTTEPGCIFYKRQRGAAKTKPTWCPRMRRLASTVAAPWPSVRR